MEYYKRLQQYAKRNHDIRDLRDKKWSIKKIAEKYGITRQRVETIIRRNGAKP